MNEPASPSGRQAQPPKAHHAVFVSYSSQDEGTATSLCSALEAEAIRCWMAPRDVQGGRPYSGQITQAIREAQVLLLVLSQASNRSKQVLREVERAAHCQNHLLTFRIEAIAPGDDLAYFLGADHWVDGFRPPPPSQHFRALIQHTRALLQSGAAQPEEEPDTSSPEVFAHFRVLRRPDGSLFRLGKGGMGVTYKAIDTVLNRPVALKVVAAELLRGPASRQRFLREAQSAALIHHPHVATIFHFGEEGDSYFYAMEFVDGEDLERYVAKNGPLPPATAFRVVLQVAQALEAAQVHQLIHRDIKPGNVMAVANRIGTLDVKLIDFGLAKGAGTEALDSARLTRTQDFVGSPAFASPEQCQMENLDIRSDIYSLGVTLWYLLTGKQPFSGTVGQVLVAQVVKPPPFEQLAQVPEPVIALLRRMLAKNPSERFQTPEELQAAVETVAERLASDFGAVSERLPVEVETAPAKDEAELTMLSPPEPVVLSTPSSPLFDSYLAVEMGALVANRYRLVAEEREGTGGRFFKAKDEKGAAQQPTEVGLKLLHPGIANDPALMDLLKNEIGVIRQATHPNLVRYWSLEHSSPGPWLVREWVHGFLLYDLLRWRRSLKASELPMLLDPLANTLDFVAGQGLGLVNVSVRKILITCPADTGGFESLARGDAREWARCALKLNPLSLAPLLFKSRNGWDLRTIVPMSPGLSMTQAEAGIRGTKAVRLYGRLMYELLSGRPPAAGLKSQRYGPLPELDQAGNEILRRACDSADDGYRGCQEFWRAFKENLAVQRSSSAKRRPVQPSDPEGAVPLHSGGSPIAAPMPAQTPQTEIPPNETPLNGPQKLLKGIGDFFTPRPPNDPKTGKPNASPPPPMGQAEPAAPPRAGVPPPKRPPAWTLRLMIVGGAAIIGLAIFAAIRSGNAPSPAPTPVPLPSPVVTTTPAPAPLPSSIVTTTPAPSSTVTPARLALEDASKEQPWINSLGMKFVPVPGTQTLFSIWDTRVRDFKAFVGDSGYGVPPGIGSLTKDALKKNEATWESPGFKQGPEYPVVGVNWDDAKAFCTWLTKKEHAMGHLPQEMIYRLPTDTEWSAAAGLGYEQGDTPKEKSGKIADLYAWGKQWPPPKGAGNYAGEEAETGNALGPWEVIKGYNDGWPQTSPVGAFAANRLGLYDISGNVWQWCEDWSDKKHQFRVNRGGSWVYSFPPTLLLSCRAENGPRVRRDDIGFRSVLAPGSSR
jgi:serine/threonine protein kinase